MPQPIPQDKPLHMFLYEGTDAKGQRVQGSVKGHNMAVVKAELRRQGIIPIHVVRQKQHAWRRGQAITSQDIAVFSRQMATLIKAGITLVQALDILGRGHDNLRMQNMLLSLKNNVEKGDLFSNALRQFPQYFDPLFCNLIQTGEQSGTLEWMLERLATHKEKIENIKARIKKALFYPVSVLLVAVAITCILMIYVVPQFEEMFQNYGAELPRFTRMVIAASHTLSTQWHGMLLGLVVFGYGFVHLKRRHTATQWALDRLTLRLPIVGSILKKGIIARFARTLSTTFSAGVPLVMALEAVAHGAGNLVYERALLQIRDGVSSGQQIQLAMRNTRLFPSMVVQMIGIGEDSGSLDQMLSKIAEFYENEVNHAVDAMSSLIEPVIMVVLGGLLGGLVTAMYLPIFQMGSVM